MRFSFIASLALAGSAIAAPVFPLADGFPSPSPAQLKEIESLAGGPLPNGALPSELTPTAIATLQLLALNELFEVFYFTTLLKNITDSVPGYELTGAEYDRTYIIDTITAIKNQEELHAAGVNGILANAKATTIAPCEYSVPVSDYLSAIALANTFTDVVLGVLPNAQTVFGSDAGDETGLVALFGSVIAQEAEQNGWYRSVQKKIAPAAPFLTTEAPQFAFTFLKTVIVPGSCPGADLVSKSVPTFEALNVVGKPAAANTSVEYSVPGTVAVGENSIVYLSGPSLPIVVPITDVVSIDGLTHFMAEFPFASGLFAKGLTIAAVVKGSGPFANSSEVAAATLFGPGIIEVD
jgi:hypothetical protein